MLMGLGRPASTVTEKTEALTLGQGPGGFRADWTVTLWPGLQSGAGAPGLWTCSVLNGLRAAFLRNLPKELVWASV